MASFNEAAVVSAVNGGDTIHITDTGGNHRRVSVDALIELAKAQTLSAAQAAMLDELTCGCKILALDTNGGVCDVSASSWPDRQRDGYYALGVVVESGDKHLVVAPSQSASIPWGSTNEVGIANDLKLSLAADEASAYIDFKGKSRTKAISTHPQFTSDGVGYAHAFCTKYSRTTEINGTAKGIKTGAWWMPSAGEMAMICANYERINTCLALIRNATLLRPYDYWTSTEKDANVSWKFNFLDISATVRSKTDNSHVVLPVTEYPN